MDDKAGCCGADKLIVGLYIVGKLPSDIPVGCLLSRKTSGVTADRLYLPSYKLYTT